MSQLQRIIGIDLGTTNSVVAIMEGAEPLVVPNQEGANKTPSVVAFLDNEECIVGEIARRQAATNPARTITSIKRLMGKELADIEEEGAFLPYNLAEHDEHLLIDIDGLGYAPEQISALILRKLKESAESYLGEEVTQAVITVPAHFDDIQRNATMEAARLAGLDVLRLLNEPTAAALAYGVGKGTESEETVAIYDFGGGTFDISLLEVSGKTFEVLTSTGDTRLGGDDLDDVLVKMIVEEFFEDHGVNLAEDPVTIRRLKEVAEKAKCELSMANATMITLPFIAYSEGQPLHLDRQITRDEFEDLIESFVNRTIKCCKKALEDAGLTRKDIGKVILVGGSTRIPMVQEMVEDFFGLAPFKGINPDEVVALGAATQAGIFSGNIEEVTLIDVAPHSLGIEVKDGKFSRIIEKNATIPHKAAKNFTTTEDNQSFVVIHILQGEGDEAAENKSLGKFILSDIPPAPRGATRIRVTFFMNADGVMEISAEELGSGAAKSLTILHSDLDEREKKQRRRRKGRRKGGSGRPATTTRYSPTATGGATDLTGTRGGRNADSSVVARQAGQSPDDDSAATQPRRSGGQGRRNADSSAVEDRGKGPRTPASEPRRPAAAHRGAAPVDDSPDSGFAILGDTNPGITPTHPRHHRASAEAIPLKGLHGRGRPEDDAPKGGPGSGDLEADFADAPVAEELTETGERRAPAATPAPHGTFKAPPRYTQAQVRPPQPAPPREQQPQESEEEPTQAVGFSEPPTLLERTEDEPLTRLEDEPPEQTELLAPEHDRTVDEGLVLPPSVNAALERAQLGDDSAGARKQYEEALLTLNSDPWAADERWGVLLARSSFLILLGRSADALPMVQRVARDQAAIRGAGMLPLMDYAVENLEQSGDFRRARALMLEAKGDLEGACEDVEIATKADPQEGDAKELERLYRARMAASKDPAAQFKLVRLFLKANRVDEAIVILQDLQHEQQYETRALKILGLCHWQKNLHYLAWQKFQRLRQTDEIKEILYRLGNDMETTGQLQNALAVFEHLAEGTPDYRDVATKVKKLRYRVKMTQDESHAKGPLLSDPRFTIIEEINRGSMGIIFKARDKILDEVVALKVLNDYLCSDPSAVERFKREARAAKKLAHPYIVRIHDMFESGSKRFISMEYIEGTDFKRMLTDNHEFTEQELAYYTLQICDALAYAHKLNIIHRDIKPANIMVTKERTIKVTDFGIAKILKGDDSTKSGTAVIGTPLYMAPEQITGEGVDARSDIYSLGIMMYELISGQPPFYLGNIEYHHIHTPPPALPDGIGAPMRQTIMRCVEKNPENRFQSVEDLYEALKPQA